MQRMLCKSALGSSDGLRPCLVPVALQLKKSRAGSLIKVLNLAKAESTALPAIVY